MKRTLFTFALLFAAATNVAAAATSRYLVATRFAPHLTPLRLVQDPAVADEHDVRAFQNVEAFAADLTEAEVTELRRSAHVRYIEPVVERHALGLTLEENRFANEQSISYGVDLIHAREVWNITRGGDSRINVAILDTGIDIDHPDLKGRYAGGYNTFETEKPPIDDNRHGTHVAGIIGADDNGFGVVGVAPEARIWSVKGLDKTGFGSNENIIAGIDWLIAKKHEIGGNWILNLSLGSDTDSSVEREAFLRLHDEGFLVIAAAGNRGINFVDFPAAYPTVLGVGATNSEKNLAGFSSFGAGMAMVAPGERIASTVPHGVARAVDIEVDGATIPAAPVEGSPLGEFNLPFAYCGFGHPEEFPAIVRGRIAVLRRAPDTEPNHYFYQKVLAAQQAGAVAVVIINRPVGALFGWTLTNVFNREVCDDKGCRDPYKDYPWLLTVGISYANGEKLLEKIGQPISVSYRQEDYDILSGTSMSAPHVVGAAALLWSLDPNATAEQVRAALELSAVDLGKPGRDLQFGNGLLDVLAAAKMFAPEKFGLPPVNPGPRRRAGRH